MKNGLVKYRQFYTGTDNSAAIQGAARQIKQAFRKQADLADIVMAVRQFVNDACYDKSSGKPVAKRLATSLLESRRAKASELISDSIASCGSMATLATSLLSGVCSKTSAWVTFKFRSSCLDRNI